MTPQRGDRFIHAHHLSSLALAPYEDDTDYQTYVVTRVTGYWVYYGETIAKGQFKISRDAFPTVVRRWIKR
jgi:hypothetical protein